MQDLEYLGRYLLEHQLQERRRTFADVRRDRAARGVRRSARLVAQQIRASRRHDR
jgi:hypothetical protein